MEKTIATLGCLFVLWNAPALAQNPQFPQTLPANTVVGRTGIGAGPAQAIPIANLVALLNNPPNTWTALQTFNGGIIVGSTSSLTISATPTYNLASNTLAAPLFMPLNSGSQTVPASDTFNFIRGSNSDGTDISFTVGASGLATGPYFSLTAASGSSVSSNVYGGTFHAQNAGPGTVRGAHLGGFGLTGSTGVVSALALQIQPVSTNSGAFGAFASLTSSGVNGLSVAYDIETNGDTYALGFGSTVAPVGYTAAAYRAWMATASSAGARAFQTLNNAGTEIQYVKLDGTVVSTVAVIGGTESNGINLTQAALTRNNVAGSMNIVAGTNAGNSIVLQTGGSSRFSIADTQMQVLPATASTSISTGALVLTGTAAGIGLPGAIYAGAEITTGVTTVASLPTCNAAHKGARHFVTDNNTAVAYHAAVTAGGASQQGVTCDGTAWYQD